ncbi:MULTISPECIES: carbon-nitrogen hydrolase family protein [unclassified Imperialibacter]|uniref:carbon-nitrogen hydrolase family protein n=1 Tax=unclassified Imperialibacter TaxID=2629706 RepID=UPI00125A88E5|nr:MULTISPECIES: carbon-nitrogen hydrolase family protein [unclassified Imperialibacter]CAD5270017.1 Nitrilase [Imperialibacter sp. 89]CAD5297955.1 Nitrilase [Imperialibacter sp. 75]VVT34249.1 Nitrilase [Imperialibacter sp. EC-SDR9]
MKVAIIQHAPEYLDKKRSLEKALALIKEAASGGNVLAVFGESWLSGYPAWLDYCPGAALWNHEPTKEVFAKTYENAIVIDGPEMAALQQAVAELGIAVCIGINEKKGSGNASGTLFNSMALINSAGELVVHHRKLMPTFTEKLIYGVGDGNGLRSAEIAGARVGGLICWEHWMPLTRQAMHETGEEVHIALWPTVHEMHQVASRQYAFEGRCFVLAVGQILRAKDIPAAFELPDDLKANPESLLLKGGSCVVGPDGFYIREPIFDLETTIEVELPLREAIKEKMTLDVTGHYKRTDIFDFQVNSKRNQ